MTEFDAVLILDPKTSESALAQYTDCESRRAAMEEACRIVVKAIRRQSDEPLTPEQLMGMDNQPVWVEFEDGSGGLWGIVHLTLFAQICFANGLHCTIGKPYYGRTYKAYAYQPAHIDREAWTAEWRELHGDKMVGLDDCGEDVYRHYHYSVCTSCGKGTAVKSNFCPVCGKAMTPEAWAMLEKRLRG